MDDQNNKTVDGQETQGQQQEVQQQQQNVQPQQPTEQQKGFGTWCKRHWKGLVAAVTGAGVAAGSAVMAYKKGKAAGINSVPMPEQQDDYSLNPNND